MIAHIVIGATGTGKSTFVKNQLTLVPNTESILVFDVNNEYSDYCEPDLIDFEDFTKLASKARNSVIVFEEATIFISTRSNIKEMRDILVRKRHTHNHIILCFHSFRTIPRYIFDLCTHITVFKSLDNSTKIRDKFEDSRLCKIFNEINISKNPYDYRTLKIY